MRSLWLILLLGLLCGGCPSKPDPSKLDCVEFMHQTTMPDGKPGYCKVLWCSQFEGTYYALGGPTALWCKEKP